MGNFGEGVDSTSLSSKRLGVFGVVSRFIVSSVLVLLKVGIGDDCASGDDTLGRGGTGGVTHNTNVLLLFIHSSSCRSSSKRSMPASLYRLRPSSSATFSFLHPAKMIKPGCHIVICIM